MGSMIMFHNKKILSGSVENNPRSGCEYRGVVSVCPMRGSCLDKSKIYKAEVTIARETNTIMVRLLEHSRKGSMATRVTYATRPGLVCVNGEGQWKGAPLEAKAVHFV